MGVKEKKRLTLEEVMLGLKVAVKRVPLFAVEVESVVKADEALVVSAPLLSVTVTKTGWKVLS